MEAQGRQKSRPKSTQIIMEQLITESKSSDSGIQVLSNVPCFSIIMIFFLTQREKNQMPIQSRDINQIPTKAK